MPISTTCANGSPAPGFSQQLPDAGWDYGTERGYLVELVAYWRDEYDWRRAEATLNSFDNFLTEVDGTRVHFIHAPLARARRASR